MIFLCYLAGKSMNLETETGTKVWSADSSSSGSWTQNVQNWTFRGEKICNAIFKKDCCQINSLIRRTFNYPCLSPNKNSTVLYPSLYLTQTWALGSLWLLFSNTTTYEAKSHTLQFLLKLRIVSISCLDNSKSNTWQGGKKYFQIKLRKSPRIPKTCGAKIIYCMHGQSP